MKHLRADVNLALNFQVKFSTNTKRNKNEMIKYGEGVRALYLVRPNK